MAKQENATIQSVERALLALQHIADHPERKFSLSELTEYMELDKSSVFRLLSTLMKFGLVRQDEHRKTWQLGYRIFSLAGALRGQLKITELAASPLRELAAATHENAHLAVRSGLKAVFIDRERASKAIASNTDIGDTEDLHCTAVGKCLISALSADELERLYGDAPMQRYTDRTITSLRELSAELEAVRARGYGVDDGEFEPNVVCIAAPVYDYMGRVEAAIGISGPRERMETQFDRFSDEVRGAGRELSALLGFQPG